jgi:predicted secreted protein
MLLITIFSGCTVFRDLFLQPLPKQYDNAFILIKSENALVQQQSSDKEFKGLQQTNDKDILRVAHARLNESTEDELASQGDLKVVTACKTRTLKITQDIENINVSSLVQVKRGFWRWSTSTGTQSDDIHVSISTTIEDCESGKKLAKFTYENNGQDLIAIIRKLASWNVTKAYEYQYGLQR